MRVRIILILLYFNLYIQIAHIRMSLRLASMNDERIESQDRYFACQLPDIFKSVKMRYT